MNANKIQKRILVIDDEAAIRKFLKVSLENEGFLFSEAKTAKEGIQQTIAVRPDIIILDLGLPDRDGCEVIKMIREWSQVSIVVLTVRDDEESKVKILDAGADDYLTKPFGVSELLARLRVAERHSLPGLATDTIFKSGPLVVDLSSRIIKVNEQEVHLTVTEYDILKTLIKFAGKVVTHRQLLKEIWGPNATEHKQYIRVYVGHLRQKLEPKGSEITLITTETGVGYRLMIL